MKAFFPAKAVFTAALMLAVSSVALAQTQPPTGSPEPSTPTAVPIDGGAALLLAGGVAYGLKKLRRRRSA